MTAYLLTTDLLNTKFSIYHEIPITQKHCHTYCNFPESTPILT